MNPIALVITYLSVLIGPLITVFSSNLFLMWIGLEMNMLAMVPLMVQRHNPRSTEAATKYFLTQAIASTSLLFSMLMNFKQLGVWTFQPESNNTVITMMFMSMAIKLGLAPFHSWLPEVTQGIKPEIGLILLTWQKIAPMSILIQFHKLFDPQILILCATASVLAGAWGGLGQTQTRKIMAYSSIANMGWMISVLPYNPYTTALSLLIYISMTAPMFMILCTHSFTTLSSMAIMWNKVPALLPVMLLILMSTGGLPPLTGFLPKWAIITELLKNDNPVLSTLLAMLALINLYFYTRLVYLITLTTLPTNNNTKMLAHQKHKEPSKGLSILTVLTTLVLPLSNLLL
uniref:NADH-ubiquinone oxidoreductase chain 2 n=1 Tax=Bramus fuscocapillus TaxID=3370997 RepID=A0A873AA44_9RODE|nr:NADH dehydrogenase subunit 2 [Ellobius fuscocapillus]